MVLALGVVNKRHEKGYGKNNHNQLTAEQS